MLKCLKLHFGANLGEESKSYTSDFDNLIAKNIIQAVFHTWAAQVEQRLVMHLLSLRYFYHFKSHLKNINPLNFNKWRHNISKFRQLKFFFIKLIKRSDECGEFPPDWSQGVAAQNIWRFCQFRRSLASRCLPGIYNLNIKTILILKVRAFSRW